MHIKDDSLLLMRVSIIFIVDGRIDSQQKTKCLWNQFFFPILVHAFTDDDAYNMLHNYLTYMKTTIDCPSTFTYFRYREGVDLDMCWPITVLGHYTKPDIFQQVTVEKTLKKW